MRPKCLSIILIAVAFSIILTAPVMGEDGFMGHYIRLARKVSKEDMSHIYQQLNLTEQQKGSLENNRKKHRGKAQELRAKIRALRQQLKEEIGKPDMDEERIRQLKAELNKHQSALTDLRVEGIMGIREILTPEQYNLFYKETK